jgi:hydrogenase-4 component E
MISLVDTLFSLVLLSVLFALGSSRIMSLIKVASFQGVIVSIAPIFLHPNATRGTILFCLIMMIIRGIIIPGCLVFAVRKIAVKREIEPLIGYHASLFVGLLIIIFSIYISGKFTIPLENSVRLALTSAITVLIAGMFLLMSRRKAITMLIGYLMLENGIYLMGTSFSDLSYHLIEFGMLLDVLAGVMIMGIVLYNIKRTFDDIDTTLLRNLTD